MYQDRGLEMISSEQLGAHLHMTPAQIRKDLSYFGRFGKQGRGYDVRRLMEELRRILGLDRPWNACVVGVGRLGQAIISYPGFVPEGFRVVSAFDADKSLLGEQVGNLKIQSLEEIPAQVRRLNIAIGIVAVPAAHAQQVIDLLIAAGIRAILNYAPITPLAPNHVRVRNIDPVLALQSMTYYLKRQRSAPLPTFRRR